MFSWPQLFRRDARRRPVRWWPLLLILVLEVFALVAIRLWPDLSHQQMNIFSAQAVFYALVLILIWALLLSRMTWRRRLTVLGLFVFLIGATAALFRIRGVSGDLLPILEWRFGHGPDLAINAEPGSSGASGKAGGALVSGAADYPQFLGPHRDGTVPDFGLDPDWVNHSPKLLWRRSVGPAWSGFAVRSGMAVTQEQRGEEEFVICYDLNSGAVRWVHQDTAHYKTTIAGEGPRATPTIAGARVYTMGATGILNCLDLASGAVVWSKNVPQDNGGQPGEWGDSCSPLLVHDLIVVTTGASGDRSLAAYQRDTGVRVWSSGRDRASYSSPVTLVLGGVEQIVVFNSASIAGHDPKSGQLLWDHAWPSGQPHIATPVALSSDRVLASAGYGMGSELLAVRSEPSGGWRVERVWKSLRLKSKFANLLPLAGYIYGLDDGIMVCLDAKTGELKWKEGRYGHGQMILVGEHLLLMAENGELVLLEPSPDAHRELARCRVLSAKTWNPPALAGAVLLVRNDQEAACYELPVQRQAASSSHGVVR